MLAISIGVLPSGARIPEYPGRIHSRDRPLKHYESTLQSTHREKLDSQQSRRDTVIYRHRSHLPERFPLFLPYGPLTVLRRP